MMYIVIDFPPYPIPYKQLIIKDCSLTNNTDLNQKKF